MSNIIVQCLYVCYRYTEKKTAHYRWIIANAIPLKRSPSENKATDIDWLIFNA